MRVIVLSSLFLVIQSSPLPSARLKRDVSIATASQALVNFSVPSAAFLSIYEHRPTQPEIQVCDETNAKGRSHVYCSGRLLDAVNTLSLFKDSKTFVDRPIKANHTGDEIYKAFENRFPQTSELIDKDKLLEFVEEYFDKEGQELEECDLSDWTEQPPEFATIANKDMHDFALALNVIWKSLCRRVKPIVRDEPERFSLIYVPENFVAPGGRFREFYYWDAYWIIKGLIASGMMETTRGMIQNFASIVEKYGFIPNGGRVYYLQRSQPPLLTPMVYEYYQATKDTAFLKQMLPVLEKELNWWKSERSLQVEINGINRTVYQYRTPSTVPRPESYREDVINGVKFQSFGRRQLFYKDVGSAAESGWDFSSRWFAEEKIMLTIHTTNIVPVDLNAFICYNMNILSALYGEIDNPTKERSMMNEYLSFRDTFRDVFHVPNAHGWYDYHLEKKAHNTEFYPSIAVPLFTGCYERLSTAQANDIYDKMADLGALGFIGGVPTSLAKNTQEQWDFPNGWSPLNHMIIEGLRKSEHPRLQQKAYMLAEKWIRSNYHVWQVDKAMWEKYNVATNEPRTGGGGEYEVQGPFGRASGAGFGWTNGVILDLLITYGDRITDSARIENLQFGPNSLSKIRETNSGISLQSNYIAVFALLVVLLY